MFPGKAFRSLAVIMVYTIIEKIFQDITQQHLCDVQSVDLVEKITRYCTATQTYKIFLANYQFLD